MQWPHNRCVLHIHPHKVKFRPKVLATLKIQNYSSVLNFEKAQNTEKVKEPQTLEMPERAASDVSMEDSFQVLTRALQKHRTENASST